MWESRMWGRNQGWGWRGYLGARAGLLLARGVILGNYMLLTHPGFHAYTTGLHTVPHILGLFEHSIRDCLEAGHAGGVGDEPGRSCGAWVGPAASLGGGGSPESHEESHVGNSRGLDRGQAPLYT